MIGRVTALNGTMQRSGDEAIARQAEQNKSILNQAQAQQTVQKGQMQKVQTVNKKEDVEYNQEKYDAKEKGKGEYFSNKKKKKEEKASEEEDGKVIIKSTGNFDIKI